MTNPSLQIIMQANDTADQAHVREVDPAQVPLPAGTEAADGELRQRLAEVLVGDASRGPVADRDALDALHGVYYINGEAYWGPRPKEGDEVGRRLFEPIPHATPRWLMVKLPFTEPVFHEEDKRYNWVNGSPAGHPSRPLQPSDFGMTADQGSLASARNDTAGPPAIQGANPVGVGERRVVLANGNTLELNTAGVPSNRPPGTGNQGKSLIDMDGDVLMGGKDDSYEVGKRVQQQLLASLQQSRVDIALKTQKAAAEARCHGCGARGGHLIHACPFMDAFYKEGGRREGNKWFMKQYVLFAEGTDSVEEALIRHEVRQIKDKAAAVLDKEARLWLHSDDANPAYISEAFDLVTAWREGGPMYKEAVANLRRCGFEVKPAVKVKPVPGPLQGLGFGSGSRAPPMGQGWQQVEGRPVKRGR